MAFQWHSSVHWTSQCTLAQGKGVYKRSVKGNFQCNCHHISPIVQQISGSKIIHRIPWNCFWKVIRHKSVFMSHLCTIFGSIWLNLTVQIYFCRIISTISLFELFVSPLLVQEVACNVMEFLGYNGVMVYVMLQYILHCILKCRFPWIFLNSIPTTFWVPCNSLEPYQHQGIVRKITRKFVQIESSMEFHGPFPMLQSLIKIGKYPREWEAVLSSFTSDFVMWILLLPHARVIVKSCS